MSSITSDNPTQISQQATGDKTNLKDFKKESEHTASPERSEEKEDKLDGSNKDKNEEEVDVTDDVTISSFELSGLEQETNSQRDPGSSSDESEGSSVTTNKESSQEQLSETVVQAESKKASEVSESLLSEIFKKHSDITINSFPLFMGSVGGRSLDTNVMSMISNSSILSKNVSERLQDESLDRFLYYELYNTYSARMRIEKYKNDLLQVKMANYYRKRKMFHVIVKEVKDEEAEKKYFKYLDELETLNDSLASEQLKMQIDSDGLKSKFNQRNEEVNALFAKLVQSELELAKEFADTDPIRDNIRKAVVEKCMKRQRIHLANLKKIRLSYIKCRNMLEETQEALDALDNLGPNLRLMDYEQLKFDNRNLQDKLEEKDMELTKVRTKCQNAMQVLAHQREKIAAVNSDIADIAESLDGVNEDYIDAREQLNALKQERDYLRYEINKLKEQSGLTTKPLLLRDMENTITEAKSVVKKVNDFKKEHRDLEYKIHKIRSLLDYVSKISTVEKRIQKLNNLKNPRQSSISDVG